jgi:hypothetical protein
MSNKDDYSGCLIPLIIISAIVGIGLLCNEGLKSVGHKYEEDPGSVIGGFLAFSLVCYIIYRIYKKR